MALQHPQIYSHDVMLLGALSVMITWPHYVGLTPHALSCRVYSSCMSILGHLVHRHAQLAQTDLTLFLAVLCGQQVAVVI